MRNTLYHLQLFALSICLLIATVALCMGSPKGTKISEFLFYHDEGPLSPHKFIQVTIREDGSGKVESEGVGYNISTRQIYRRKVKYSFRLSSIEMEALKTKIQEAAFFSQPDKDTQWATDTGKSTLRISLDARKRQIDYEYRPEMAPITNFLYRLVRQADAMDDLKNHGQASAASSALSPYTSDLGVLQPHVFLAPMKRFVHISNDPRQLSYAAQALSWHMSPKEWLDFWSSEMARSGKSRRLMLLELLADPTNQIKQPEIGPLFLKYLKQEYKNWPSMSDKEHDIYISVIFRLLQLHYAPSAPVFADMINRGFVLHKHANEVFEFDMLHGTLATATASMGNAGIDAVQNLLGDARPKVREYAVNTFASIAAKNKETIAKDFGPKEVKDAMLKRLKSFLPKLKEMANGDPDSTVRQAAQSAVKFIEAAWMD